MEDSTYIKLWLTLLLYKVNKKFRCENNSFFTISIIAI